MKTVTVKEAEAQTMNQIYEAAGLIPETASCISAFSENGNVVVVRGKSSSNCKWVEVKVVVA